MDWLVMIYEFLVIILIIVVLFIFLLFFKTWYLYIIFQNDNLAYNLILRIKFVIFEINIEKNNQNTIFSLNLNFYNHSVYLYHTNLIFSESTEIENDQHENEELFTKINEIIPLLFDAKEELYEVILLIIDIIKFNHSTSKINLGLKDNNLTIKVCNLIWMLSAPLYPFNFQIVLTPEINKLILSSDNNIKFELRLYNIIKIIILFIKSSKLNNIIKSLM